MQLFANGKLNTQVFEMAVRQATHDLADVLLAAADTQSPQVESTHFLIALGRIRDGDTIRGLADRNIGPQQWASGLGRCARKDASQPPPGELIETAMDESALDMLEEASQLCQKEKRPRISEAVLLLSGLRHLTTDVEKLCRRAGLDVDQWCQELERRIGPVQALPVFTEYDPRALITASFSPMGRKVLRRMGDEAESLGYKRADPRHLLMALLSCEGGATQYGLFHQGKKPRDLQQAVTLSLRSGAKRQRSSILPDCQHFQGMLQVILFHSGELAGADRVERIGEPHLLRAFLSMETTARAILENEGINVAAMSNTAERYEVTDEEDDEETQIADIDTARHRLEARLVGQQDAIDQILPYIELMRFGFNVPNRPVAVFLFCGASGTGKTEMAKELARSIYGSEENLIFLEMGQFNRPEHINQFIGAPPGYVGYGEGKLTNGLRDKPRSVVLFDEVEKAAEPRVHDALLRFLDEGKIEDPAGPVRDGTQCIVVLTSNVASEQMSDLWDKHAGKANRRTEMRKFIRERFQECEFRVEFLNRVDEIVVFRGLQEADFVKIAQRQLVPLLDDMRQRQQIEVQVDDSVTRAIGAYCQVLDEGARPVARMTRSLVLLPVARYVAVNRCRRPVTLKVRVDYDQAAPDDEPQPQVEPA